MNIRQDTGKVLGMALPSMAAMTGNTMVQMVDTMYIGRISPLALAAAGLCGTLIWNTQVSADGLAAGITASFSRSIGERDNRKASEYAGSGLWMSLLFSCVLFPLIIFNTQNIFTLIHMPEEITELSHIYFTTMMYFLPPFFGLVAMQASFNAAGETRVTMRIGLLMNIMNIILDRILIFGLLSWPGIGIRGAALASGISFTTGFLILMAIASQRPWSPLGTPRILEIKRVRTILKIGLPTLFEKIAMSTSQMLVMVIAVIPLGALALGTFQIVLRLASLSFMPGFGFSIASATLTGQALGEKKPERARELVHLTTFYAAIVMSAISLTYFFFPDFLTGLFTEEASIKLMGQKALKVYACFAVFLAPTMVYSGALRGAGDTRFTFLGMLISRFAMRLPLSIIFGITLSGGLSGVWLAMSLDFLFRAIIMFLRFKHGKWEHIVLK